MGQICSQQFVCVLVLGVVSCFWFNFYIGTLQMQAEAMVGPAASVYYTRFFTLCYPLAAVLNPFVGMLFDAHIGTINIIIYITSLSSSHPSMRT
jgi:ABC-type polysaccharide/polyol phosphate export permease